MSSCITNVKTIQRFLNITNGDWRRSVYVECKVCKYEPQEFCGDFLCAFDEIGSPVMLPISDCKLLFSCHIDPNECLLRVTHYRFREIYSCWIKARQSDPDRCPFIIDTNES